MPNSISSPHARLVRAFATRMGHDAVWLMIAGLFCVVEGAVKVTELGPRFRRRRRARIGVPVSTARLMQ